MLGGLGKETVNSQEELYVCDNRNNRLQVFNLQLTTLIATNECLVDQVKKQVNSSFLQMLTFSVMTTFSIFVIMITIKSRFSHLRNIFCISLDTKYLD